MSRAEVACVQCRRRKIACSKKIPHCTECLVHGRDCCYDRDKRRRVDSQTHLQASSISSTTSSHHEGLHDCSDQEPRGSISDLAPYGTAEPTPSMHHTTLDHPHADLPPPTSNNFSRLLDSSQHDMHGAMIPDVVNDTFWWLASQWQMSLPSDPAAQWSDTADPFIVPPPTQDPMPFSASVDLLVTPDASGRSSVSDPMPCLPSQHRAQASGELYQAYKRCLPERKWWPRLFTALKKLCQTAHGGSEAETSPFVCLTKLQKQLEQDIHGGPRSQPATNTGGESQLSPFEPPGPLRRAWTLAALCLADSLSAMSPIELPPDLGLVPDHERNPRVQLFSVSWAHCRAGLCGDPVEVMQTYRMMSLAFSRCHKGHELASTSVFLGCRAAVTMSIHRAETIASLGSSLRQQEALNAFWHLVSQGCHFKAWEGRDIPIDMAIVDLPMPDPKSSLQPPLSLTSSDALAAQSPRSQMLSSSPVFMTRIWTSVAIGQTVERYYRQGASLVVPCEARLQVAIPLAIRPSGQEQECVKQTTTALDLCASLLQTRGTARIETKEAQLRRFVLMLVRYSRVLLHYPFCRVDKDHRRAAQESISAIVSTVLGTLLSLGSEDDDEGGDQVDATASGNRLPRRDSDGCSTSSSDAVVDACGSDATRDSSRSSRRFGTAATQPVLTRSAKTDRHLLELLAGLSVRALVFTLALIQHAFIPSASDPASNDDTERQRMDAVLSLRALEQLHQHGVVSSLLLRKARKIARGSCAI